MREVWVSRNINSAEVVPSHTQHLKLSAVLKVDICNGIICKLKVEQLATACKINLGQVENRLIIGGMLHIVVCLNNLEIRAARKVELRVDVVVNIRLLKALHSRKVELALDGVIRAVEALERCEALDTLDRLYLEVVTYDTIHHRSLALLQAAIAVGIVLRYEEGVKLVVLDVDVLAIRVGR